MFIVRVQLLPQAVQILVWIANVRNAIGSRVLCLQVLQTLDILLDAHFVCV